MNKLVTAALGALLLPVALSAPNDMIAQTRQNPFMVPYETPFGIPPFEQISYEDYMPAIEKGIADKRAEIEAIANNPATPTFDNTILAMEKSGDLLQRVMLVFGALDETDNNEQMLAISEKAYPMVSAASDEIMMNDKLFQRLNGRYENIEAVPFTREVEKYMARAHLMLSKPGGITCFEAIAARLPILAWQPFLQQEQENADFLVRHGMARIAAKEESACLAAIRETIYDDAALSAMERAMEKTSAALTRAAVCGVVAELVREKVSA